MNTEWRVYVTKNGLLRRDDYLSFASEYLAVQYWRNLLRNCAGEVAEKIVIEKVTSEIVLEEFV